MQLRKGDDVRKGAVFVGRNENGGRRWTTTCTVTDADPGRVSLSMLGQHYSDFTLAIWHRATEHGCRVAGTWDQRQPAQLPGWPPASRIRASVAPSTFDTLQRLRTEG